MLRLGIAGIGAIAGDYIGFDCGRKGPDVALTALCSRNEAHIREGNTATWPQAAAFTDYGAMLSVWPGRRDTHLYSHAQHPRNDPAGPRGGAACAGGEASCSIFADEVAEILPVLAERPELVCGVMYNRRAAQAYRHVKNLVQSGELGELVRCSWIITNLYRTEAYYTSGAWRDLAGRRGRIADDPSLPPTRPYAMDLRYAGFRTGPSLLHHRRPIQVENEAELFLTYLQRRPWAFYCFSP